MYYFSLEIKDETFSEDLPTSAILRAETVSTLKIHHLKEENEQAIPEIKDSAESQRDEKFSKEDYYLVHFLHLNHIESTFMLLSFMTVKFCYFRPILSAIFQLLIALGL